MGWKYQTEFNYFSYWFTIVFFSLFIPLVFLMPTWWMLVPAMLIAFAVGMARTVGGGKQGEKGTAMREWKDIWQNEYKPKP